MQTQSELAFVEQTCIWGLGASHCIRYEGSNGTEKRWSLFLGSPQASEGSRCTATTQSVKN